jgi:hypothetical protein
VDHVYVSGTLGTNNPSKEVLEECKSEYTKDNIAALISIGAGHDGAFGLLDLSSPTDIDAAARRIATDAEPIVDELGHRFHNTGNYFRLSVQQGLQESAGDMDLEEVEAHTIDYLRRAYGGYYIVEDVVKSLRVEDAAILPV